VPIRSDLSDSTRRRGRIGVLFWAAIDAFDHVAREGETMFSLRSVVAGAAGVVMMVGLAAPAAAQDYGVRAGISIDPDQFYFGGHYQTAPLVDRLRFRPNVEIGVGDDVTVIGFNFEFAYFFPDTQTRPWQFYAGAGPALNIIDTDSGTDPEGGFNILFGVEHRRGLFFEFKVGTIDSPDLKFGVGYSWR
jgi:hypothetical protein